MQHIRKQFPLLVVGFFGALLLQGSGCWSTCDCPPVEIIPVPDSFDSSLIDVYQRDYAYNEVERESSTWSDITSANLSREGNTVTLTYTTAAVVFQADFDVTSSE